MPNLRFLHIGVLVSLCLEAASPWQAWPVPPREIMADITNDLGICLLQVIGRDSRENIAFSPYGVMSIVFLLYEGSHGNTAIEIYNSLRLPWDRHMSRIGFRDLHRHIKSYFSNDRFLRGLVLSKPSVPLKQEYVRLLNFYGFHPNREGSSSKPSIPPAEGEGKGRPGDHSITITTTTHYIPSLEVTHPKTTRKPFYTTTQNMFDQSSDYDINPTTNYHGTDVGYESEPTIPHYDPTKFPSKTTVPYTTNKNTQRRPPKTTPYPVTFDDITTVKPGYNSHGMTQFFPDFTPTTIHHNDQPTEEDNIIPQDDIPQNSHQRPTMQTTTNIYNPPKNGFTDPITEHYYTTKKQEVPMTTRSTRPPQNEESDNEVPISFPDENTKASTQPNFTPQDGSTFHSTGTVPSEGAIVYPTDTTSYTEDETNTGIDVRFGNLKSTTPLEILRTTSTYPDATVLQQGRNSDNEIESSSNEEISEASAATKTRSRSRLQATTKNPQENILQSTTQDIPKGNFGAKIMTQKDVQKANEIVEQLDTMKIENTYPGTATTPTLATILMSIGYTSKADLTEDFTTEASTLINQISTTTTQTSPGERSDQIETTTESSTTDTKAVLSKEVAGDTTTQINDNINTEISTPPIQNIESINSTSPNKTQEDEHMRKKRSLLGPPPPYDHRDGSTNWIPPAEGPHWEYSVPRDQWFFTYSGSQPVTVLTYMDYLPFAFIESINTLALKLPLDDPRYSMLILLPMERYGLEKLLASLHQCSLREILQDLRVIPIYAVLPAFTLVKHVNIVPALASMGIEEVFDPSRSDLSGMADEPHLYVRSIEQLVTVSLRKYHYANRRYDGRPEEIRHHFIANHPFIYFVLDSETNAALMAGTIVDPTSYKQDSTDK